MSIENECGNKRAYRSKSDAKQAEARIRTSAGGPKGSAYRCSYCNSFHIGHGGPAWDSPRRVQAVQDLRERMAAGSSVTPESR
jgi:hypothetical protein